MAYFIKKKMQVTECDVTIRDKTERVLVPGIMTKDKIVEYADKTLSLSVDEVANIQYLECVFKIDKQTILDNCPVIEERNLNHD